MRVALLLLSICALAGTKKAAKSLVTPVTDQKEFKKLLRTKTNVMVLFTGNAKKAGEVASVLGEVSRGVGKAPYHAIFTVWAFACYSLILR